ncbi:hypothetical protein [Desulfothermobacter acidiphilus]|uniref:hypothetical protein n=1 Tax=Desulfothermobacter acidiphilus TaxID=1938353 RepID=UPI003F89DC74
MQTISDIQPLVDQILLFGEKISELITGCRDFYQLEIAQASKTPRKVEEFLPAQKANQQSDQPQGKRQKAKNFFSAGVTLRHKKTS